MSLKNNNMVVSSASKAVKFLKAKTPSSEKKKFAKTPHSSKTPNLQGDVGAKTSPLQKKKRKLSFGDHEDSDVRSPAPKTPVLASTPGKSKKVKTPSQKKNSSTENVSLVKSPEKTSPAVQKKKRKSVAEESDSEGNVDVLPPKTMKLVKPKSVKKKKANKEGNTLTEEEKRKEKCERTIFVGNLPPKILPEKLTKLFKQFGEVESVRFRCIPLINNVKNRKAGAILKQFTGSAVSAFIKFATVEEAKKSVAMNGTVVMGHHIRVDLTDPTLKPGVDKKRAVFLRNLSFQLTEDQLWAAFEKCGKVESVRIIKDVQTYLPRGMGYVNFVSSDAVELALKLNDTEIIGRPVKVHRCVDMPPRPKKEKSEEKLQKKKKIKKGKVAVKSEVARDFTGKKSQSNKNKKPKKLNAADLKKKKLAQVLSS